MLAAFLEEEDDADLFDELRPLALVGALLPAASSRARDLGSGSLNLPLNRRGVRLGASFRTLLPSPQAAKMRLLVLVKLSLGREAEEAFLVSAAAAAP